MVITALALLSIASSTQDFFPCIPGAKYTYEESGAVKTTSLDTILPDRDFGGRKCTVILTERSDSPKLTTFYTFADGTLYFVGQEPGGAFPEPFPVAKIPTGKEKVTWSFSGKLDSTKNAESLRIEGEAKLVGIRKVLGKSVEVLEVKTQSLVGDTLPMLTVQTSLYARGIGLVELNSSSQVGRKATRSKVVLKGFQLPSGVNAG